MKRNEYIKGVLKSHGLKGSDKQVDNFICNVLELGRMIRRQKDEERKKNTWKFFQWKRKIK